MDSNGLTRFPPPKSPTSNHFLLSAYLDSSPPPSESPADADLTEDDIFATDFSEPNDLHRQHHRSHGVHHLHHHNNVKNFTDSFGIRAALPKPSPHSHFYRKAAAASAASRTIPSILKPTQEQVGFGKYNQYQSAPVKVPMLTNAMKKSMYLEEEDVGGDMMVPPHEMVERRQSPIMACSVMEGAGRTLKGRDLKQVRNAVWRQTGFMD